MRDISATAACGFERGSPDAGPTTWRTPDSRRVLQLVLAAFWLLDAVLQAQPFMFTRAFGRTLAVTAVGNPAVVAAPIGWAARLVEQHAVALNTLFAAIQLLLALGIAWRPTVRLALGASIAWATGVWWLGEGLGGVLSGAADPVSGAPGAVVLYALVAVVLWPARRDRGPVPFVAARAVGASAARILWLALWIGLACAAIQPASRAPWALHNVITGMASGEPGWLAALERTSAAMVAHQGVAASIAMATVFALVGCGVYLPARATKAVLLLAIVTATAIWVVGEALGGILTGSGTDPGSGPLLVLLAFAYWPMAGRGALLPGAVAVELAGETV